MKSPARFVDDDASFGKLQRSPSRKLHAIDLAGQSLEDLASLRAEIDTLLPSFDLKSINMEHELLLQLVVVKKLQKEVLEDDETPANQRAQCAGQVAALLATLAKLQDTTYSSERMKGLENAMVEAIKSLPEPQQLKFFERYTEQLRDSE